MNGRIPARMARRAAVGAIVAALLATIAAMAYFTSTGKASGHGAVGQLAAPTIASATPGAGTVALSWSAVTPPASGSVAYYVTRNGGTPGGNCPTAAAPSTTLTSCTDSGLTKSTYTYAVVAIWQSWTATSKAASASVASGPLAHFALSTPSGATAGSALNETITAQDAQNNTVTAYIGSQTITFSGPSSSPGGNAPTYPASVSFASGQGTASITLYDAQSTTLTATQGTITGTTGSFTVSPASASKFSLPTPGTQTAGTAFNETITALDTYGNTATAYTGSQTITFTGPASSPGGTAPSYPASVTFTSGQGTASITLYDAQTTTLTATQGTITGTTGSFGISSAGTSKFSVPTPGTQSAGVAFNETITATDAYGNTTAGYSGSQTITFSGPSSSPGGNAPSYPASVGFTSGQGTASITLYDAQTTTLTATQSSITGTTGSFTVSPASAAKFSVPTPSTQTAGTAFNETITALDTYGNTATSYTGSKTITFTGPASSPGGTAPSYPSSVTFTSGQGTASITLYDAQTTTLTAAQGSITGVTGTFTINASATRGLVVSATTPQTAGTAFNVSMTAEDTYGNVLNLSGTKSVSFSGPANAPNGTAPVYPTTVSLSGGSGTAPVKLYDAQTTTITVTDTTDSVTGTSSSITVNPTTASNLWWTAMGTPSKGSLSCAAFTCTWAGTGSQATLTGSVAVTDAYGNIVSGVGSGHSVAIAATAGLTVTGSPLTISATGPAVSTTTFKLTTPTGNYGSSTITATSTGYTSATMTATH